MRVTSQMMGRSYLNNLNSRLTRINKLQNEISSGSRLQNPSDDPIATIQAMKTQASLERNKQYSRNITDGKYHLNMAESSIYEMQQITSRARDLALMGSNATYNAKDRKTMAVEVNQLLENMLTVSNTTTIDGYLFGGNQTEEAPFAAARDSSSNRITEVSVTGDVSGKILRNVGQNDSVDVNVNNKNILYGYKNIFQSLVELRDALEQSDVAKIANKIDDLDTVYNQSVNQLGIIGAKGKYLDETKDRLDEESYQLTSSLSEIQGTDLAKSIVQLQQEQLVYQAALSIGGEMLRTSIVNFLK